MLCVDLFQRWYSGASEDLSLSNDASTALIYEINGIPGGDTRKREARLHQKLRATSVGAVTYEYSLEKVYPKVTQTYQ